jgi:hypothetical protein
MKPVVAKALKVLGTAWCVIVVGGYIAMWLFSEHGGGLFSREGWGEVWLIALACVPGVAVINWADRMAGSERRSPGETNSS